jgi:uncharacterized protein
MKMSDEQELPVSQDIAWNSLNDIDLIKTCIPGCESIVAKDDGSFDIAITASVGPVRAKFKGQMRMKDADAPQGYTLEIGVQGGAVGHGRGEILVQLRPVTSARTMLIYTASASVGGKLAQVGARLIDLAAQKMAADFFSAFLAQLELRYAPGENVTSSSTQTKVRYAARAENDGAIGKSPWNGLLKWISRLLGRGSAHSAR